MTWGACQCVAVPLTDCRGLTGAVTVDGAAEERLLARWGGQARCLADARWVVGTHVVLSGQAVAGHATVSVGHLLEECRVSEHQTVMHIVYKYPYVIYVCVCVCANTKKNANKNKTKMTNCKKYISNLHLWKSLFVCFGLSVPKINSGLQQEEQAPSSPVKSSKRAVCSAARPPRQGFSISLLWNLISVSL